MVCSNSKITNIDICIFLSESRHYNLFHMSSESRHYNLFHKYHFMLFFLGTTFVEDNLSITTLVDCHSALQLSWYFISQCNFCSVWISHHDFFGQVISCLTIRALFFLVILCLFFIVVVSYVSSVCPFLHKFGLNELSQ